MLCDLGGGLGRNLGDVSTSLDKNVCSGLVGKKTGNIMAAGKTHTTSKKWVDSMGRDKQEEDG